MRVVPDGLYHIGLIVLTLKYLPGEPYGLPLPTSEPHNTDSSLVCLDSIFKKSNCKCKNKPRFYSGIFFNHGA